jgi:Bifunctional DNA primase/polymerase, N-terminal/Primase C terminal 1 (PriCT-1)
MTVADVWPCLPQNDAPVRDYATMAARVGWSVFPVSKDKQPLTENGFYDATTDLSIIERIWSRWSRSNLAIATGVSRLAVIDVDPSRAGRESFNELIKRCGPDVCATLRAITGSGGEHWYYSVPSGITVRCSVGALAPGLDVRAEGGYVVAPSSMHALGKRYSFDPASWGPPAPLGDALLALLQNAQKPLPLTPNGEPIIYRQGERNSGLASLAGGMRRRGMTTEEIAAALHVVNRNRCDPRMTDRDVDRIASSVARYQPQERRGLIAREVQSA